MVIGNYYKEIERNLIYRVSDVTDKGDQVRVEYDIPGMHIGRWVCKKDFIKEFKPLSRLHNLYLNPTPQ